MSFSIPHWVSVQARYQFRRTGARSSPAGACLRVLSAAPYPESRAARHSRRSPSVDQSSARRGIRFPARSPIEDCWSVECIPQSRSDFGSKHRLGPPQRAAGSPVRIRSARGDRPTKSRPARLPLTSLQDAACGGRDELVGRRAELGADLIHCLGNLLGGVAGEVLLQGVAEKLASRPLGLPGQFFCAPKNVVWNRHGRFHTQSITTTQPQRQRLGARSVQTATARVRGWLNRDVT